ncbi:MAG: restriction endonuclease [Actinomycetota bacterium]
MSEMTRILWLDDDYHGRPELWEALQDFSADVVMVPSERFAVEQLEQYEFDLFIQDLHRRPSDSQFSRLPPRTKAVSAHDAGWGFYRDVLRPGLPQLPVIIVSLDAHSVRTRRRAYDFNLTVLHKVADLRETLPRAIVRVLAAQREVLKLRTVPPTLVLDFNRINQALLKHMARHPEDLERVSWKKFEELIEVLLRELGYEVNRTRFTRDGGVDLWAVERSDFGEIHYAIDTKKYARSRRVGPHPVRAIHGVADLEQAHVGVIVTTSTFGPGARKLEKQYSRRIALKDFEDVTDWIRRVSGSGMGHYNNLLSQIATHLISRSI